MSVLPVGISGEEAGGGGGYQIERSLRFNSVDSAYLNRTFGTATDRKKWTLSVWAKFKNKPTNQRQNLLDAGAQSMIGLAYGTDWAGLHWYDQTAGTAFYGTRLCRDPSAWMHIFVVYDSTQATAIDRIKFYVNNIQDPRRSGDDIALNAVSDINSATAHTIGTSVTYGQPLDGYLAEYHFVDGQALTPTDFGEFNEDTGVWQPKAYTGSYGTNGFYLDFADNTSTTTLGYDAAGSNDWTLNNFSVTAGAGNDSLVDSPTRYGEDTGAGGEVRGSYCTLNPLDNAQGATLSNGNLQAVNAGGTDKFYRATFGMSSGKWYWEVQFGNLQNRNRLGITDTTLNASGTTLTGDYSLVSTGNQSYNTSTGSTPTVPTFATNDYICFAFDADAGTLYFEKNATPNLSTSPKFTGMSTAKTYLVTCQETGTASTNIFNFGQRPFAYTAPSGFLSLCTTNLPEPTIADGGEYFNAVTYSGNNQNAQSITSVGFQPDFIWIKNRNASNHVLVDAVRGRGVHLASNLTNAEATDSSTQSVTAFLSNGFSVQADPASYGSVNNDTEPYVAWNWKANGSGVSNTDGTITSTVSANTDAGFSIVTWTSNGNGSATVGHGLGVAPKIVIYKDRTAVSDWYFFTTIFGSSSNFLRLNTTAALGTSSNSITSTTFNNWFGNTNNLVAYCFAPVAGYSAFGSYTGNGSADGTFVYMGFRPAFVMIKCTSISQNWVIKDTKRGPYNAITNLLRPNLADAEIDNAQWSIDFTSNGMKMRYDDGLFNTSGATYIYAAFAENPFAYSLAR